LNLKLYALIVRITAGLAKGQQLHIPPVPDLRPTKGMVRQAIFSIINEAVKNARVLDLYAGSGSLGLEALSRGACWVDFVDISIEACRSIKQNAKYSTFLGKTKIHRMSADNFLLSCPPNQYHLIFADPPYELNITHTLAKMPEKLKLNGLVVYLHHKDTKVPPLIGLNLEETRNYGITGVSFLTKVKV